MRRQYSEKEFQRSVQDRIALLMQNERLSGRRTGNVERGVMSCRILREEGLASCLPKPRFLSFSLFFGSSPSKPACQIKHWSRESSISAALVKNIPSYSQNWDKCQDFDTQRRTDWAPDMCWVCLMCADGDEKRKNVHTILNDTRQKHLQSRICNIKHTSYYPGELSEKISCLDFEQNQLKDSSRRFPVSLFSALAVPSPKSPVTKGFLLRLHSCFPPVLIFLAFRLFWTNL